MTADGNSPHDPASSRPVAFVTGSGAARVGAVIAQHFARVGYDVALHALTHVDQAQSQAEEIRREGRKVIVVQGPVEDPASVDGMLAHIWNEFGRLDVVVNSAAIWHPTSLEQITVQELRRYFDVNAIGSFLVARAAGLLMVKQPHGGAIINIGDWALARPYMDHAAYFPSKGAVEAITRALAVELAQRNPAVRVNCILPGPVLLASDVDETTRREIIAGTLVKRLGEPEHIAHAAQFLAENSFVTGVSLPVDGGKSIFADDPLQTRLRTG